MDKTTTLKHTHTHTHTHKRDLPPPPPPHTHTLWGTKSQDSVHKPQPFWTERRAEAELSRGPSAYQPKWPKDKSQAAESIKWRPQQAYGSNQFLLVQPQTVFSTHPKSSRSRIDKITARATGNTRYRYNKIAPLDHKMADNCVSLARAVLLSMRERDDFVCVLKTVPGY